MDLNDHRQEYAEHSIDVEAVDPCPMKQFELWFKDARDNDVLEPNAMVLSTVGGMPHPANGVAEIH